MAAEIARDDILAARRQELVVLVDDYGAELHVTLPVSDTPEQRAAKLAAFTKQHSDGEAQLEAYAAAAKMDLTTQKAAGQEKRAAMQKKYGIAPSAVTAASAAPAPAK